MRDKHEEMSAGSEHGLVLKVGGVSGARPGSRLIATGNGSNKPIVVGGACACVCICAIADLEIWRACVRSVRLLSQTKWVCFA